MSLSAHMKSVLMAAIWAPSGDNGQPWTVRPLSTDSFEVDLTRIARNSYNLLPIPDWVSLGMFLENGRLMAEKIGYDLSYEVMDAQRVRVTLSPAAGTNVNALLPFIESRSVNRYAYKTGAMTQGFKDDLHAQLDDDVEIFWYESFKERLSIARLMMRATDLRLRMDETYSIHKELIDWSGADSMDKLPMGSIGLTPPSLKMMKWVLDDQARCKRIMKLPAATLMTQIELDLLPGLLCAGHYVMTFNPEKTPKPQMADYLRAGHSMQRFWLRLTQQGYAMQPWYVAFMFSLYMRRNIAFTARKKQAQRIHDHLVDDVLGPKNISLEHVFFTGRIGVPKKVNIARSIRKPLDCFLVEE